MTLPFRTIRLVSALVAVLSLVALGLIALPGPHTVTKHTTVTKKITTAATSAHAKAPTPSDAAPVTVPSSAPALVAPPSLTPTVAAPSPVTQPTTEPVVAPTTAPVVSPGPTPTGLGSLLNAVALPACPLPLPTPAVSGGLQSQIPFAPLFGPFSAEAFASAAAFQPVLQLFGPFLIAFANEYAKAAPALAPLVAAVESLENKGFSLLSPLYSPYRAEFLTAETTLAAALATFAQALASNPGASCLVDFEGLLTSAA
jgi:hypothetical protein